METQLILCDFGLSIAVALLIAAASIAISELLRPKPTIENAKPANLGDFDFPTAIEGRVIPLIFGRVKVSGPNVTWYGDFRQKKIKEKIKTGYFSSKTLITGYRYFIGIQFSFCLGAIDGIRRVWVGEDEVYSGSAISDGSIVIDEPDLFGGSDLGSGGMSGTLTILPGSTTQTQPTYLADFQTPAVPYRGVAYAVWEGGEIGTSTTIKPWAFEVERYPNQLGIGSGHHIVNDADSNPAAILYEYLTNDDWGLGQQSADVDTSNFLTVAETLYNEGNGVSFIIDNAMEGTDFISEIERQIDGKVLFNMETGQWQLSLARNDYDIESAFQISDSTNLIEVEKYDDGLWENTVNDLRLQFSDRARDYFDTYARGTDLANFRIQGKRVMTEVRYPGVKDRSLANQLASREIVALSVPLKTATLIVDRTAWNVRPVDVISWTDSTHGFSGLAMRVQSVDLGELADGRVKIQCIQDVFGFGQAIFGDPPDTLWTIPTQAVAPIPANEQVILEAPYSIAIRDPDSPGLLDRLWCGARRQTGAEASFRVYQRNDPSTPSGAYTLSGEVYDFFLIGEVRTALNSTGSGPGAEQLEVDPTPDALLELEEEFTDNPTAADLGQNLLNLLYVGGEFMAFRTISNQGAYLLLTNGYRALLDSTPSTHAVDTKVYLVFVANGITSDTIPPTNVVDIQLRSRSRTDEVAEVDATTVQLQMDNRARRAIIPVEPTFNGIRYDDPVDVDDLQPGGSGLDDHGIDLKYNRRDYRHLDEVQSLGADAETFTGDFPAANSHENQTTYTELDETLSTSLDAFWKLEEASGTRFDETANDVDLTDNATVTQNASGKIGASALFTASNSEYLEASTSTELDYGDVDWSVAGWFKLATKAGAVVFSKWTEQSNQRSYRLWYDSTPDRMKFEVSGDGTAVTTITANRFGSPNVGEWVHFYAEHDATINRIRVRFNFHLYDEADHTGGTYASSTAKFRLGSDVDSGGTNELFWDGEMDAIGAWGRKLSESEQGLLYLKTVGQEHPFAARRTIRVFEWDQTANPFLSRTEILDSLEGSLPDTDVQTDIEARHTFEGQAYESREVLSHSFDLAVSDVDSLDSLGLVRAFEISPVHKVDSTATWNFEIGVPFDGTVDARLNGGSFSTVIAAGDTTGTLSVTSGDDLEIRHGIFDQTITAGSFIVGFSYTVLTLGTTDFTLVGASSNTIGLTFTATDVGTGTGTVSYVAPDRTLLVISNATPTDKAYAVLIKGVTSVLANLGAHYKLNEASGDAIDSHINGLNMTLTGSVGSTTGIIDGARGLVSTGDAWQRTVAIADTFDIRGFNAVSFFCWVNINSVAASRSFCSIWDTGLTARQAFIFEFYQPGDDIVMIMGDGAGGSNDCFLGLSTVPSGTWMAVGFSYDPELNLIYGYANIPGVETKFTPASGTSGGFAHTDRWIFGLAGHASGGIPPLEGYIDSASWWKGRVLLKPHFDWLAEGHDLEDFDLIP